MRIVTSSTSRRLVLLGVSLLIAASVAPMRSDLAIPRFAFGSAASGAISLVKPDASASPSGAPSVELSVENDPAVDEPPPTVEQLTRDADPAIREEATALLSLVTEESVQ